MIHHLTNTSNLPPLLWSPQSSKYNNYSNRRQLIWMVNQVAKGVKDQRTICNSYPSQQPHLLIIRVVNKCQDQLIILCLLKPLKTLLFTSSKPRTPWVVSKFLVLQSHHPRWALSRARISNSRTLLLVIVITKCSSHPQTIL